MLLLNQSTWKKFTASVENIEENTFPSSTLKLASVFYNAYLTPTATTGNGQNRCYAQADKSISSTNKVVIINIF